MSLRAPWPAGSSSAHLCAKCGEPTEGIPIGGLCHQCRRRIRARAARLARWIAIGTTLPLAVYVTVTLPRTPDARIVGAAAVLIWYVLTSLIVRRVAWEWLK
jgi:hypothetical protein